MQLAISSIFFFLVILPGVIARYFYQKGNWKSPVNYLSNITHEIAYGVTIAVVIHLLVYWLLSLINWEYDFTIILPIATGNINYFNLGMISNNISEAFPSILVYFILVDLSSAIAGFSLHMFIRKNKLDLKFSFFKFKNEWYYHFNGESLIIDFFSNKPFSQRLKVKAKNIEQAISSTFVYIAIVVNHGCGTYLYRGILKDFSYDKTGQLERIVLTGTLRRPLTNDKTEDSSDCDPENDERFYHIDGDFILINYSDIVTMNVDYRFTIPADC